MKEKLKLVRINTDYCNYLRKFDDKVPYNFKVKELRPFIGILFTVNECMYFAPLSSPKPKHLKLKDKIDFLKLDGGKLGAINFNNMLPVSEKNIIYLNLYEDNLSLSEKKYNSLLKSQLYWLNRNKKRIYGRSKKLYDKYITDELEYNIKIRCCNFILLEEKCYEYNK
ncbi:MAG: type III toxin-antitoxin system ToxN/AbiQ family toxin [Bacilli bacterium]